MFGMNDEINKRKNIHQHEGGGKLKYEAGKLKTKKKMKGR